jgi:DNA-binding transcriptional LysR family regulator
MNSNNQEPGHGLQELAVFAAVAETHGFSAAARRLGTSKSMVSTAVSRLEQRWGVRLLERTTRRLSLTEAGAAVLPHAQRLVVAARDAEEAAMQARLTPRGVLKINAPMSFGLLHLVPALGAFAARYPEVKVELVLDDRVLDLTEGGFDLAVRIGNLSDSTLVTHRLGRSRNVIVACPEYLARAGTPKTPASITEHAALVYSVPTSALRWTLTRDGHEETVRVLPRLLVNSSLALEVAVHQGLGLARLPEFIVGKQLSEGTLVRVLPDWSLPEQGIFALTTTRDQIPRKTSAFIEFFRERLGAPAYWETGGSA